jgi:photosystem II stability/assembly factor-like uncharacterized protein/sugar lactone lactonase YvrE
VRKAPVPVVLLILVLAACAGTPQPTILPAPTASLTPPARATVAPTAAQVEAGPTLTPTPTPPVATPAAAHPAPTPTAAAASPWPSFLRERNFGMPAGNSYTPRALAVHPGLGRLYARTVSRDTNAKSLVTVLDLTSRTVLDVVETGTDTFSEGTLAVDTARNRVYALNPGDLTCSVLDAENLAPVTTLDGLNLLALDQEGGRLYTGSLAGLRALDVSGYATLLETPPLPAYQELLAMAVDPAAGRLYLAYQDDSGYKLGLYDLATLRQASATPLPGRPDALLPDPDRGRLYTTLSDGEHLLLWTLDTSGRRLDERQLGGWTQRSPLALDPEGRRLFLGRDTYGNYGITVLDAQSGDELADIPLDRAPNALTWDEKTGLLLVSHTYSNQISAVDIKAGQVSTVLPTALNLVDLAVDPERGHLYVTDSAGRMHVLNSDTDKEVALLPGEGLITVDSPHGRVYTGGAGASRVRVFDADRLQQTGEIESQARPVADAHSGGLYLVQAGVYIASLETMTVTAAISGTLPESPGYSPNPAAVDAVVDPGSGRLFVIINNGVPGSNNGNYLYVYEPVTYEKVLTDTERSSVFVDVDQNTGQAYVSRTHIGTRSTSLLGVERGFEYTARLDALFGALRVDPALGRLYLTVTGDQEGYLLVLDARNLDLLGSLPIPGQFVLRALDPQRHLLYLARENGQVQIWSATGGELPAPVEPIPADLPMEEARWLFLPVADGSLYAGSLYRSEDEGKSWVRLSTGLPRRGVQAVVISPDYVRDQTLFAVLMATDEGLGIWKSADGGRSWRMANTGLSDLAVTSLAISPVFAADQTLFATARRGGLFRSTDGGKSWMSLRGRYRVADSYAQPGAVVVSPTYGQDHTLFVGHAGLQRSADGGETWTTVSLQSPGSLALSPAFAADRTLFGWFGSRGLLRSTDGGDSWSAVSAGLALSGFGSGRVLVAPDYPTSRTLYFLWTPVQADLPTAFFRSTDSAATWEVLAGEPPAAATLPQLSPDGSAFEALDSDGRLIRWPVEKMDWQPAVLPPLNEISVNHLALSPGFAQDRTLLAVSEGAGILRSGDAGLTWNDTGFPLRMTYGGPPELVLVPPDTLLVGTALGLYRSEGHGPWSVVRGGLPQGVAVSSPQVGPDGSLRVLVGGGEKEAPRVYVSTDGGQTWTRPVPDLPYYVKPETLLVSPAFVADRTAYTGEPGEMPQRTSGGRGWEAVGPPGDWTLSALQISPAFDQDGLLFMRLGDNSLWRSTDRGDTWTKINGPWGGEAPMAVAPGTGYVLGVVTFSAAYADDGVLLTRAGNALYRSTDQGKTWTKVLDLGPSFLQTVFAPDYARNGLLYLLQGRTLYRSADTPEGTGRGRTWQALPPAPWDEYEEIRLLLSPAFSQDRTMLAWTLAGRVWQSSDGGKSWREAGAGLPAVGIREVVFSPGYAVDSLVYLVPYEGGIYKRVGGSSWIPVTETPPPPTAAPAATPGPRPTAPPTVTPASVACAAEPTYFRAVWQQAEARLGCPEGEAQQVALAEQPFEQGHMIWDSSTRRIYVLRENSDWYAFDDTFVQGVDPDYDPALPPPPKQPQRGFGKVWRERLGGPQADIGWALEGERAVDGWRQRFEHALLVWTGVPIEGMEGTGTAYLLYDDGTWQAVAATAP